MGTAQRDASRKKERGDWKRLGWLAVLAQYNTPELVILCYLNNLVLCSRRVSSGSDSKLSL